MGPRADDGSAQVVLTEACETCRVVLDTVAALGDARGPGMLSFEHIVLQRDGNGRYYLLTTEAQALQRFTPEGVFLDRTGSRGEGPGEFLWPQSMHVDDPGNALIVDRMQNRLTFLSPDLGLRRTAVVDRALTPGFEVFALDGDSVLIAAHSSEPALYGIPAHVLSPEGRRVRSFGEPDGPVHSQDPYHLERRLAIENGGGVWVADKDRYTVELWSLSGERQTSFSGDVSWFEPLEARRDAPDPPRAILRSMKQDPRGLLWIAFAIPGERWEEAHRRDPDTGAWRLEEPDAWMTTVIDVVDAGTGRLLARRRLPGLFTQLFGSRETLTGRTHLDLGEALLQVLVIRLELDGFGEDRDPRRSPGGLTGPPRTFRTGLGASPPAPPG